MSKGKTETHRINNEAATTTINILYMPRCHVISIKQTVETRIRPINIQSYSGGVVNPHTSTVEHSKESILTNIIQSKVNVFGFDI